MSVLKPPEADTPPSSAVFQAGGLVVVLVEVMRKAYLASIVPVIVNVILNEHQMIVDIIAFVSKGDFPRSRLGEKQRGKILASWVTRKMRTIAQFGIRDSDGADSQITEVAEPRSGVGSVVGVGSSLKNVETITENPMQHHRQLERHSQDYASLPTGISEMPAPYESSIVESPPLPSQQSEGDRDGTPTTEARNYFPTNDAELHLPEPQSQLPAPSEYYPVPDIYHQPDPSAFDFTQSHDPSSLSFNPSSISTGPPPRPRYDSKPSLSLHSSTNQNQNSNLSYQQPYRDYNNDGAGGGEGGGGGGGGRLRIANAASSSEDEVEWPREAIMYGNLGTGGGGAPPSSASGVRGQRGRGEYGEAM